MALTEIPRITDNHNEPNQPGWAHTSKDGIRQKPIIRCVCGWFCGIGLHHVHKDGTVTASFFHDAVCDPGRGCGWHVFLKLLDYDGEEFLPERD